MEESDLLCSPNENISADKSIENLIQNDTSYSEDESHSSGTINEKMLPNELHLPVENNSTDDDIGSLKKEINLLRLEKNKMEEEFGAQRAKLKDIFLQKDNAFKQQLVDQEHKYKEEIKKLQSDLDDCRSQLTISDLNFQSQLEIERRKCKEEVSSLQHLLTESVEESSKYIAEIKRLSSVLQKLNVDFQDLKNTTNQKDGSNDMPQLFTGTQNVISTIARKVTNITNMGHSTDNHNPSISGSMASLSQFSDTDSLDDSMRKAQEDAVVLRSLVVPLEEEIKALKEKIREMDIELEKHKNNAKTCSSVDTDTKSIISSNEAITTNLDVSSTSPPQDSVESLLDTSSTSEKKSFSNAGCDMCVNWETQLLNAQQKIQDLEKHIVTLERYKQQLSKESELRKIIEQKWNEKKEEYKAEVDILKKKVEESDKQLKDLNLNFSSTLEQVSSTFNKLNAQLEANHKELERLEDENDNLIGKYNDQWRHLQNENINLPNNVEELQEIILQNQHTIVEAKLGREHALENIVRMTQEMENLKNECVLQQSSDHELNEKFNIYLDMLRTIAPIKGIDDDALNETIYDKSGNHDTNSKFGMISSYIDNLIDIKKNQEDSISELRKSVASLQSGLNTNETVQSDFVRLTQTLQKELENIRLSETELRWEHDEDVTVCRQCNLQFQNPKQKLHCRHCGRIYCGTCLKFTVYSGPNARPSKVCNVCHTLLEVDAAPFFSHVAPQND